MWLGYILTGLCKCSSLRSPRTDEGCEWCRGLWAHHRHYLSTLNNSFSRLELGVSGHLTEPGSSVLIYTLKEMHCCDPQCIFPYEHMCSYCFRRCNILSWEQYNLILTWRLVLCKIKKKKSEPYGSADCSTHFSAIVGFIWGLGSRGVT